MLAIVPVRGRNGKTRLDGFLSSDERARLAQAMLADVLAACAAVREISATLVVTPDPSIADHAEVLTDLGTGHAEAIKLALGDRRTEFGALVVMGDCPLVSAASLDRLVNAARPLALARASDGGVNAAAFRKVGAFDPAFGAPDGAAVMVERARAAGIEPVVVDDPALALDVDNPADVWRLREYDHTTRAHEALVAMLPPTGGLV